jgi:hypothetical protein
MLPATKQPAAQDARNRRYDGHRDRHLERQWQLIPHGWDLGCGARRQRRQPEHGSREAGAGWEGANPFT